MSALYRNIIMDSVSEIALYHVVAYHFTFTDR